MTETKSQTALIGQLIVALRPPASLLEINGPAFCMFAEEVERLGKPVGELTLNEIAQLDDRVRIAYNARFA